MIHTHSNIRDGDVVLKQETAGSSRKERVTNFFALILIFSKAYFQKQCVWNQSPILEGNFSPTLDQL